MNKRIKYTILAIISVAIIVCAFITGLYTGYVRFNYPSASEYPIRGIDVSHHQGHIDWAVVKEQNIRFVFIKATEGGDFRDKNFSYNWTLARENKILTGAYHFFTFCKSGKEQAFNFIETVPVVSDALPPVIDLEFGGNCKTEKTKEEVLAEIDTLQHYLYEYYHKKPILYVTKEFYEAYLIGQFMDNPIWYRNIYHKPHMKDERDWLFWQYANRGYLKGIDTYVDLNVFNGKMDR